jgi:hypothetical protein
VPAIKVSEFVYGRLQSPDLDGAEAFLTEFGMERAERTKTALYMRGTDPVHHLHVTERGEPGGGKRVRLIDPDGYGVEIVSGIESVPTLPVVRQALNSGAGRPRNGVLQLPPRGASHVKRIGHGVVMTSDLARGAWIGLPGDQDSRDLHPVGKF